MNLKYPEKEEQRDEAALKHTLNYGVYKVATVEEGAKGIIEEHEADQQYLYPLLYLANVTAVKLVYLRLHAHQGHYGAQYKNVLDDSEVDLESFGLEDQGKLNILNLDVFFLCIS